MSKQTAVRLSDDVYDRLKALSAKTGRTTTYYIREAVEAHLEDLEDIYLAEEARESLRRGDDRLHSLEEVERNLGLDD